MRLLGASGKSRGGPVVSRSSSPPRPLSITRWPAGAATCPSAHTPPPSGTAMAKSRLGIILLAAACTRACMRSTISSGRVDADDQLHHVEVLQLPERERVAAKRRLDRRDRQHHVADGHVVHALALLHNLAEHGREHALGLEELA